MRDFRCLSAPILGSMLAMASLWSATDAAAQAEAQPGAGKTLRIAQADDDTGWILSHIFAHLFEELGYEVPPAVTLSIPVAFAMRRVMVHGRTPCGVHCG